MRIISFLPSATLILLALGAGEEIVGISHESREIPAVRHLPVVSDLVFQGRQMNAQEIDAAVAATYARGQSLYRVDRERLKALKPDLLITQEVCDVCAVTPNDFQRALGNLAPIPEVLSVNGQTLDEAAEDIRRIGAATGRAREAAALLADWARRRRGVSEQLLNTVARPRVACIEWPAPIWACGHWIPDMVALAGGEEILGTPSGASRRIDWETLRDCRPEVMVMMYCGMPLERARVEARALAVHPGFEALPATRNGRVWVVDGPNHFSQSGPGLAQGIEILAKLIHPEIFGACTQVEALPLESRKP